MCLHWGEDWVWPNHHESQIGRVLQWCLSLDFSHLHMIIKLNLSEHQVLGHHTNQAPSPSVAQFGKEASSRKNPGCFKLLPLREFCEPSTRFCVPSMKQNVFWTLPRVCGLTQTCFWSLQAVLLTSGLVFCSNMHFQLLDLLLRRVCHSKSYPFNWICHRLTSLEI